MCAVHVVIIKYYNGINSTALCILNVAEMAIWTHGAEEPFSCANAHAMIFIHITYTHTYPCRHRLSNAIIENRLFQFAVSTCEYEWESKRKPRNLHDPAILPHTLTFFFAHSINWCNWIQFQIAAVKKTFTAAAVAAVSQAVATWILQHHEFE